MEKILKLLLKMLKEGSISKPAVHALLAELKASQSNDSKEKMNQDIQREALKEDIAVIGLACRFPGADTITDFWNNLKSGKDCISEYPEERWSHSDFYSENPAQVGKGYSKWGGFIQDIDQFAAGFFGISAEEARLIDPQQRLFLEIARETFEIAGYSKKKLANSKTSVFVGARSGTYETFGHEREDIFRASMTGSITNFIAARVSDFYNLKGPSLVIDTACSSSLVATHYALQSIWNGESEMSLVGGVELKVNPAPYVVLSNAKALSPNGKSYAFDRRADGFVPGEGVGAVLLKPLSLAQNDGDHIYAVIKASAINNDGYTMGITTPNFEGQKAVIFDALQTAEINPETITYIEAHGTGTTIGDPIEIKALTEAFKEYTSKYGYCAVGSIKTNIGHLDTAAGVAGLIKVILSIYNRQIPPTLNCQFPNQRLNFISSPFYPNVSLKDWEAEGGKLRAGVSSFGFGGTNCHIILEEVPPNKVLSDHKERDWCFMGISADSEENLQDIEGKVIKYLKNNPEQPLEDICFTLNTGREHLSYRKAVSGCNRTDLIKGLEESLLPERMKVVDKKKKLHPVFMFPGQGSQYQAMAKKLYDTEPTFKQAMDQCNHILTDYFDQPLLDYIYSNSQELNQTRITQVAVFAIGYSLAKMWMSWGIQPSMLLGHSVGEYIAACISGVLSTKDALELLECRGRLMQQLPLDGGMAVMYTNKEKIVSLFEELSFEERQVLSIAAENGPLNTVVSGNKIVLDRLIAKAKPRGIRSIPLKVSHAFHSPLMEPVLAEYDAKLSRVSFGKIKIPLVCNVDGKILKKGTLGKDYWLKHIMQPVLFQKSIQAVLNSDAEVLMELGPGTTLSTMVKRIDAPMNDVSIISVLNRTTDNWESTIQAMEVLYERGADIDFEAFEGQRLCKKIPLPISTLQRESCWIDQKKGKRERDFLIDHGSQLTYLSKLSLVTDNFLKDHVVQGESILPGVCYWEMVGKAVKKVEQRYPSYLEDITHKLPICFESEDEVDVRVSIDQEGKAFRIESKNPRVDEEWIENAAGRFGFELDHPVSTIDIEQVIRNLSELNYPGGIYSHFLERGVYYGPVFQSVNRIWKNENKVLAYLELSDRAREISNFQMFHPSLMDGALQTIIGITDENSEDSNLTYVPFFIEKVAFYNKLPDKCYSLMEVHPGSGGVLKANLTITDLNGDIAVVINGFTLRPIEVKENSEYKGFFYKKVWTEKDIVAGRKNKVSGHLLLCDSSTLHENLIQSLRKRGDRVIVARLGEQKEKIASDSYIINPNNFSDYKWLIEEVTKDHFDLQSIDHLLAYTDDDQKHNNDDQNLKRSLQSILYLSQALIQGKSKKLDFRLVASNMVVIDGSEKEIHPWKASLSGLVKTLAMEFKGVTVSIIDTDTMNKNEMVERICTELTSEIEEKEIALRGNSRYVASFDQLKPVVNKKENLLKPEGVYLITGGLSGIGLELAKMLARKYSARLVLLSRSGLSSTSSIKAKKEMESLGAQVLALKADVADRVQMQEIYSQIQNRGWGLNGIFHLAGILKDGLIINKSLNDFQQVMRPKVEGIRNLDHIFSGESLDFMVLFSSIASIFGSVGQADYSAANSYLDGFADYSSFKRDNQIISINWTMWNGRGMGMDRNLIASKAKQGIRPLSLKEGLEALELALNLRERRIIILNNSLESMQRPVVVSEKKQVTTDKRDVSVYDEIDLKSYIEEMLMEQIAGLLSVETKEIRSDENFLDLGLDSVKLVDLTTWIEEMLETSLYPTLLFEHSSIEALAAYLSEEYDSDFADMFKQPVETKSIEQSAVKGQISVDHEALKQVQSEAAVVEEIHDQDYDQANNFEPIVNSLSSQDTDIAVISIVGKFPKAPSLDIYWNNLKNGVCSVSKAPLDRISNHRFMKNHPDFEIHGGFLDEIDQFDPLFFNISPKEAAYMDPQQRLFLEAAWKVLENGGYNQRRLKDTKTGVFVGASQVEYKTLWGDDTEINPYMGMGNSLTVIANRVSYLLNLTGPSMVLDTACSSSLVAVHTAISSLLNNECDLAIAGGVQLYLSPESFLIFKKAGMLAGDGLCKTFDNNADGYVRGEGVGAVLLKPLKKAIKDGDNIHAVIKGSAVNHDGNNKVGISAPNPKAQKEVITDALKKANVNPETISYIEAHGTGTSLGDPVEINGLTQAYREFTDKNSYCAIGSAKSVIGHLEASAGIGGLLKVILMLKNKKLPPTINCNIPNKHIPFVQTPFYISDQCQNWQPYQGARRAGISAFGFGGTNCHMIVEGYEENHIPLVAGEDSPQTVAVSAKTEGALEQYVNQLIEWLDIHPDVRLKEIAYSLNTGKEHFKHSLCINAKSIDQLRDRLDIVQLKGLQKAANPFGIYYGNCVKKNNFSSILIIGNAYESSDHAFSSIESSCKMILDKLKTQVSFSVESLDYMSKARLLAFCANYAAITKLMDAGIKPGLIIAGGVGKLALMAVMGDIDLVKAVQLVLNENTAVVDLKGKLSIPIIDMDSLNDQELLKAVLSSSARKKVNFLVKISVERKLPGELVEILSDQDLRKVYQIHMDDRLWDDLLMALGEMYSEGAEIDWSRLYVGQKIRRLVLPGYPFQKKRYWMEGSHENSIDTPVYPKQFSKKVKPQVQPEHFSELLYQWKWSSVPQLQESQFQLKGNWVVFCDLSDIHKQFSDSLKAQGGSVLKVSPGRQFEEHDTDHFTIDIANESHYHDLLKIAIERYGSITGVLHLWGCNEQRIQTESLDKLNNNLHQTVYSIFFLGKALVKMKEKITFGVFTIGAQKLAETQQDLFPEKYAQHITATVVAKENKNIALRSADFNKMTPKEIADAILRELHLTDHNDQQNDQQIAYLEGKRYERKLEQINPIEGTKAVELKEKGTYLVTGGLGGVGMFLCQHLAQKVSLRLIVTGRTRIPDRKVWEKWLKGHEVDDLISVKIKKLLKLEELCYEVIYQNVDVSNMEQMAQLIDLIESRYEKIDGIIHCAGIYDDAMIRNKSVESFQRVMAAKVKGSWILSHLMRGKQLDFIHFCSSISALFGNEGQIDYCSANAFMDGLAAVDEKCISVNWSFWKDGGMDLTDGVLKQLNRSGVVPLERKEALNAFDTINYVGCNNVTVAKFKNSMDVIKRETESQETISAFLINLMSRLLMVEENEIDINMDFKYYGVDSLVLQDAVVELEKALGQSLEPSIFMDYPTIHLLSSYLNTKYTLDRPLKSKVELLELPQEDEVALKKVEVSSLHETRMKILEQISSGRLDLKDGMEKLSELEVKVYGQK